MNRSGRAAQQAADARGRDRTGSKLNVMLSPRLVRRLALPIPDPGPLVEGEDDVSCASPARLTPTSWTSSSRGAYAHPGVSLLHEA